MTIMKCVNYKRDFGTLFANKFTNGYCRDYVFRPGPRGSTI